MFDCPSRRMVASNATEKILLKKCLGELEDSKQQNVVNIVLLLLAALAFFCAFLASTIAHSAAITQSKKLEKLLRKRNRQLAEAERSRQEPPTRLGWDRGILEEPPPAYSELAGASESMA